MGILNCLCPQCQISYRKKLDFGIKISKIYYHYTFVFKANLNMY